MNRKLWLVDGFLFIVFLASYLWTSLSDLIFYIKFGSLYLSIALAAYGLISESFQRLLKRAKSDKQVIALGIIRTLSLGVFLLGISVAEISYVEAYEIFDQTYCTYYDTLGNIIYHSQYPGSCPTVEVLKQDSKHLKITFYETKSLHFDSYHSNIQAKLIGEIDLTFTSLYEIELFYDDGRLLSSDSYRTVVVHSSLDWEVPFSTKYTTHVETTYTYNENSVIVEETQYQRNSGSEMNYDYSVRRMKDLEYYGTRKYTTYRRIIDGVEEITLYHNYSSNQYTSPTMYISKTIVEEIDTGYRLTTTHLRNDDSVSIIEFEKDQVSLYRGEYTGIYETGEIAYDYYGYTYNRSPYFYERTSSVRRDLNFTEKTYDERVVERVTTFGDLRYVRTDITTAEQFVETTYGFINISYEKNFDENYVNTSSTGLYDAPGFTLLHYTHDYFYRGNLTGRTVSFYIPFFHEYYMD